MWGGRLLGRGSEREGSGGGDGGGGAPDGVDVVVHGELEAGPEQHVGAVDVALRDGGFLALQLEGEMLGEADAEEEAEAVVGGVGEVLGQGCAEGEGGGEDGGEGGGDAGGGVGGGEEGCDEDVFGCGVGEEREVEVVEGCFEVGGGFGFAG